MINRVILHWTAGNYKANATDRLHYHFLIDDMGNVLKGRFNPEDNIDCKDGLYAEHTGGGNTGSIGISLCGMLGFKNNKDVGKFPLTKLQCEMAFRIIAEICEKYNIPVTPQTVMTHREFGLAHPKTSSAGKIDICYFPPYPEIKAEEIGDFIRTKVKWYQNH